jgi:hypothetical protein
VHTPAAVTGEGSEVVQDEDGASDSDFLDSDNEF